jgi:hypothetical protein
VDPEKPLKYGWKHICRIDQVDRAVARNCGQLASRCMFEPLLGKEGCDTPKNPALIQYRPLHEPVIKLQTTWGFQVLTRRKKDHIPSFLWWAESKPREAIAIRVKRHSIIAWLSSCHSPSAKAKCHPMGSNHWLPESLGLNYHHCQISQQYTAL